MTNKEVKTKTWTILPPPPDTIKEYFTPNTIRVKSLQKSTFFYL